MKKRLGGQMSEVETVTISMATQYYSTPIYFPSQAMICPGNTEALWSPGLYVPAYYQVNKYLLKTNQQNKQTVTHNQIFATNSDIS